MTMPRILMLALLLQAGPIGAETVVAARLIRPHTILTAEDLRLDPGNTPEGVQRLSDAIGRESRTAIYAGQVVRPEDIGAPILVERNQRLSLVFQKGGLTITTEGRALTAGGAGDAIRVMNMSSKAIVSAVIRADGTAAIHPQ